MASSPSAYDEIAEMYHSLWADWYLPAAMPALERLFFANVPSGARVLDLCCGSGHVTKELVKRGYRVTGIDNSEELIALAKKELPGADLRVQDATSLNLEMRFDAVLSTFDSLNHILCLNGLQRVFEGVSRILEPSGLFVFDMNLDEAYSMDLREWSVDIKEQRVGMVRGKYDPVSQTAFTELIWFVKTNEDNLWRQHRSIVEQHCYPQSDILLCLNRAGFRHVEAIPAENAGVTSDLGFGRMFFVTRSQQ
jgi:SAM-dependent methyltransferase